MAEVNADGELEGDETTQGDYSDEEQLVNAESDKMNSYFSTK